MDQTFLLSYIEKDSPIHRLTGATKLLFFILWMVASMLTYDTRILIGLTVFSLILFKISKLNFRDVKIVVLMISAFLLLNLVTIYLFSPEEGVKVYGTRHEIFTIVGRYTVTWEQLFYELNIFLKYLSVIPIAILFISTTYPSEFASSLNRLGVSYKVSYAVSIALRYIPTVQENFQTIRQVQQARGIDSSKRQKLFVRIKNTAATLLPLVFSSMETIDVISNAMVLRGFGKAKKRTWYAARPMATSDYIAIVVGVLLVAISIAFIYINGGRFYSPFN